MSGRCCRQDTRGNSLFYFRFIDIDQDRRCHLARRTYLKRELSPENAPSNHIDGFWIDTRARNIGRHATVLTEQRCEQSAAVRSPQRLKYVRLTQRICVPHHDIPLLQSGSALVIDVECHLRFHWLRQQRVDNRRTETWTQQYEPVHPALLEAMIIWSRVEQAQRKLRTPLKRDEAHAPSEAGKQLLEEPPQRLTQLFAQRSSSTFCIQYGTQAAARRNQRQAIHKENSSRWRASRIRGHENLLHGWEELTDSLCQGCWAWPLVLLG
mmetsp:Transcript_30104/g.80339  ORF Transcript_30104/g.80339 Transcript_30104/m.80339 type:complete len:267 (-) Transcript_30104:168-968(-)